MRKFAISAALLLLFSANASAMSVTGYASNAAGLWNVDLSTLEASFIGQMDAVDHMDGLAYDGSTLYGTSADILYKIDQTSGSSTRLGSTEPSEETHALDFVNTTLWGAENRNITKPDYFNIDLSNGSRLDTSTANANVGRIESLAIVDSSTALLLSMYWAHGGVYYGSRELWELDLVTGDTFSYGQMIYENSRTTGFFVNAMEYNDGTIYFLDNAGRVLTVDYSSLNSGESFVEASVAGWLTLAPGSKALALNQWQSIALAPAGQEHIPAPEPGTMLMLGTGLIGLAGYGRRRQRKG